MTYAISKPANAAGSTWPAIVIGLFVAFGGILFGYDTGTISGILDMDYWKALFATQLVTDPKTGQLVPGLTTGQTSLIVSILSVGTFFGALLGPVLADTIGRRWGLIISAGVVFNFGVILQVAASAQPLFIAGRCFAGLGVGLISMMIPLYQSETAPKWIRGAIVGCYQLTITIGLFIASIVNYSTKSRPDTGSYRIPLAIQFLWSIILVGGLLILPETPRFLIKKGKVQKAVHSLSRLRRLPEDHPAVLEEISEIEANHKYELTLGSGTYLDCFRGNLAKRTLTGCGLQALQQLTGVNFIFYYGTSYFGNAGFSNNFIIQCITNAVNVASTFPGLYLVETMGRRNLLLMGAIGMCVCQFIVAGVGTALPGQIPAQNAQIAFVCIYIFFFASSWGPVAWVVTGEIFPLKIRAKGLSLTTASNWLLNWAIGYATPYMVTALGPKVFFVWGSFCFICIAFVWTFIYETKGLTLEQVDELYGLVNKAWQSKKFRPAVNFAEAERSGETARGMSIVDMHNEQERRASVVPGQEKGATYTANNEKVL